MSRRKTERLLGLVVCLLATRRYLAAEDIRAAVPGYPPSDEAFKRMFERDKDELRELGIPLETGPTGLDEPGYRISRQDYELPEITLEPDEAAVLSLAARVWRRAELAEAAAGALLKLRAAGVESEDVPGIEPRVRTDDAAFPAIWQAVRDRRPVAFSYQAVGRPVAQQRHLEPWGVVSRYGHWYVGGYDKDRGAPRVFRLSRIAGTVAFGGPPGSVTVPEGADVRDLVRSWGGQEPAQRTAVLRVRSGAGFGLRRWAVPVQPRGGAPAGDGDTAGPGDVAGAADQYAAADGNRDAPGDVAGAADQYAAADGNRDAPGDVAGAADRDGACWDRLEFQFSDTDWLAPYLASFGPDLVVEDPPDLRDAVMRCLKAVQA